jgi:hypothetical protein
VTLFATLRERNKEKGETERKTDRLRQYKRDERVRMKKEINEES